MHSVPLAADELNKRIDDLKRELNTASTAQARVQAKRQLTAALYEKMWLEGTRA